MKVQRLIVTLLAVTVVLQILIFYQQWGRQSRPMLPNNERAGRAVRKAAEGTVLDISGHPMRGNETASIALVEFSDYECPFCARHVSGAGVALEKEYVSTGKVLHVFFNNPLPMHSNAAMLATAALCAGEMDQYWPMHDRLFKEGPNNKEKISQIAQTLKIDISLFDRCMQGKDAKAFLVKDMESAAELQLRGTPAFALGKVTSSGTVQVVALIGVYPDLPTRLL